MSFRCDWATIEHSKDYPEELVEAGEDSENSKSDDEPESEAADAQEEGNPDLISAPSIIEETPSDNGSGSEDDAGDAKSEASAENDNPPKLNKCRKENVPPLNSTMSVPCKRVSKEKEKPSEDDSDEEEVYSISLVPRVYTKSEAITTIAAQLRHGDPIGWHRKA
ncbi:hypothetical protein FRC11_011750 [Ceratobasidium sp. 423]|nr:hypothetical protein FRC11_011750 [Ceratobasidium sp. 423]